MDIRGRSGTQGADRMLEAEADSSQVRLRVRTPSGGAGRVARLRLDPLVHALTELVAGAELPTLIPEGGRLHVRPRDPNDVLVWPHEVYLWIEPRRGSGWDVVVPVADLRRALAGVEGTHR